MPFGMQVSSGDFRDIIKYDARAGRMFRVDRDPATREKTQVDITNPSMKFAVDFGSLEVGYVGFTANGPVRAMVPYGKPLPQQPQDKDNEGKLISRPGFYTLVAGQAVGGIREWCSNAAILLTALDDLWNTFSSAPEAATGKIPLVSIISTVPVTTGKGTQKSTNYKPVFQIAGWVDRLPDMGDRTVPAPAGGLAANGDHPAAQPVAQPANHVPPPAQAATATTAQPGGGGAQPAADAMPFAPCWQ